MPDDSDQQSTADPAQLKKAKRWKRVAIGTLILTTLAVLILTVLIARAILRGSTVAAAFTRVGGPTRVETAVDASRFWLMPPAHVVTTPAGASSGIMFAAARCAMAYDAPLLFTSHNPKRRRLVKATLANWQMEATASGDPVPEVTKIRNWHDVHGCPAEQYSADGRLSTLTGSSQLLQRLHQPALPVPPGGTLASVVIFAVARGPGYPPDVAVGLALAAHMATAHQHVSLVVVPRFVEADYALEDQLRNQRHLVTGGVVLGSAGILTEDTDALLRQIITSTDQQGVLGLIQANLGLVVSLLAALLPLLGVAAAAGAGVLVATQVVIPQVINIAQPGPTVERPPRERWWRRMFNRLRNFLRGKPTNGPDPPAKGPDPPAKGPDPPVKGTDPPAIQANSLEESEWMKVLGDDRSRVLTVWLRSGWTVTGVISLDQSTQAVFRFNGAHFIEGQPEDRPRLDSGLSVLVATKDITSITLPPWATDGGAPSPPGQPAAD